MTAYNYTFSTPDFDYDIIPDPLDPATVRIQSEYREAIEDVLNTIELSGRANDEDFQALTIEEGQNSYDAYWYTDLSKEDLALYFEFEVRFFMGATPEA